MTPIQLINALINFICDPLWRIAVGLVAGLLALIIWRKWKAWAIAGGITWAILTGIAYLLNLPLGPPLPALPADYTRFWILIGAGVACGWLIDTILLFMIWLELRERKISC